MNANEFREYGLAWSLYSVDKFLWTTIFAFSGADITVHLVTADGEIVGTHGDDSKIALVVQAWLDEQTKISDEMDHQFGLDNAYSFGASEEEKEARQEDEQQGKSDLPIIREAFSL